jgi:hypothetical protein
MRPYLSWLVVFHVLSIRRCKSGLLPEGAFPRLARVALYTVAGLAGWLSTLRLALLIFLALPVFYAVTSEGLTETRIRLQFGKAHRGAVAKTSREGLRTE